MRTGRFERSLSALTAAGAAITAAEIYLSHDGASFGNKMMWWPIAVVPTAIPAGIAAVFSRRAAHTVLPLASAAIVVNGLQGTYLHWRGIRPAPGRVHPIQPRSRPAGVRAAAGFPGRRHGSARRRAAAGGTTAAKVERLMPYRSPDQRAVTPQGRGRYPGFDVLDSVDAWDDVTAGVVLARLAPPGELVFFTPDRGGDRRAAAGPVARPGRRATGAGAALIDARLAAGETDGWHYDDLPRGRPGLAGEPAPPRRDADDASTARGFAELDLTEHAALIQAVQDLSDGGEQWHG